VTPEEDRQVIVIATAFMVLVLGVLASVRATNQFQQELARQGPVDPRTTQDQQSPYWRMRALQRRVNERYDDPALDAAARKARRWQVACVVIAICAMPASIVLVPPLDLLLTPIAPGIPYVRVPFFILAAATLAELATRLRARRG
jgi:hypothetical protein